MPSFCVKWLADWLAETKEKKRKGKRERERERKRRGKRFSRSNHSPANVFFYFQVQCHRVFSGFLCFFFVSLLSTVALVYDIAVTGPDSPTIALIFATVFQRYTCGFFSSSPAPMGQLAENERTFSNLSLADRF